jgi:hypothetical protein
VWEGYVDDEGDQIADWSDFDPSMNLEFTEDFFQDVATFIERKKGKGDKDFTCIERTDNFKQPYDFIDSDEKLSEFPSVKKLNQFGDEFLFFPPTTHKEKKN